MVRCVATFAAQSLGRGEREECAHYTWQGIYISVVTGVLSVAFWPLAAPIFEFMKHSDEVTRLEHQVKDLAGQVQELNTRINRVESLGKRVSDLEDVRSLKPPGNEIQSRFAQLRQAR